MGRACVRTDRGTRNSWALAFRCASTIYIVQRRVPYFGVCANASLLFPSRLEVDVKLQYFLNEKLVIVNAHNYNEICEE